jgi:hypothetical protein
MRISSPVVLVAAAFTLAVVALAPSCSRHSSRPVVRASWTLTPGALNAAVTQANIRDTICVHGWTGTIRPATSYTNELKRAGMQAYGLTGSPGDYQEDHLISLELGGDPIDPRNLWPEPYPRAADVDRIENELNGEVCSGKLTLAEAQRRESALKHRDG